MQLDDGRVRKGALPAPRIKDKGQTHGVDALQLVGGRAHEDAHKLLGLDSFKRVSSFLVRCSLPRAKAHPGFQGIEQNLKRGLHILYALQLVGGRACKGATWQSGYQATTLGSGPHVRYALQLVGGRKRKGTPLLLGHQAIP